ncbi:EAL domain-containing protein [Roseibium aggregatum]|uniref:EAL domain-containing protein n=1 Tax=Roseibium aggregatum TaxID=187304 RepID=A0A939J0G9_9HYPH|nr:EAL domain-containing protein [Roseibium aggregatum]MBN9671081.1 EAL domain-containing protein [Roseibium aggregatum]
MVLCSIGCIAALSYYENSRTAQENATLQIDGAARTAAAMLSLETSSPFQPEFDNSARPVAYILKDGNVSSQLGSSAMLTELIKAIGFSNQGAVNLFKWSEATQSFDRFATTFTKPDGSPAASFSIEAGHPAYADLTAGRPYEGKVPVRNTQHLAYLVPVLTADRDLAGAVAVDVGRADALQADRERLQGKILAAALLILAGAVLIGGLLLRFELRPLRRLAKTAEELASGKQPDTIPFCDRGDEIGDLAHGLEKVMDLHDKLQKLAYTDPVTTAGNRTRYFADLSKILREAKSGKYCASLLHLDFNGFAKINDTFGQQAGNRVLLQAYARLAGIFGPRAKIARISGDDFCVLLPFDGEGTVAEDKALQTIEELSAPFHLENTEIRIEPCIGIALLPQDAEDVETAHRVAGLALRAAKEAGEPCYRFFTAPLNERVQTEMLTETLLRAALKTRQLSLHYQPQLNPTDGRLIGLEALIRWRSETRGFIPPGEFIPIAEKTGLILDVGHFVLEEACKQAAKWIQAGFEFGHISVNVSPIQFRQQSFARTVREILASYGLAPQILCLEVTENVFVDTSEKMVLDVLSELQEIGVQLSLDDFGSGYSSLIYLHRLPFQELKIDRVFLSDACSDPQKEHLFQAIAGLGRSLGLRVIAEGAETAQEFALCSAHRCDGIQGYFCSPPVPAHDIPARLNAFHQSFDLPRVTKPRASRPGKRRA